MKKIAIIGTVGVPAKYGGFETLAEYLVKYLNEDYDITVYCSGKMYDTKLENYNGAKLKYINLKANGAQSVPYDIISIFQALRYADTLLVLGVSGCSILPFIKPFSSKKIIVNIDGLEWKRHKWKNYVKWFLRFSEKMAVKNADIVISDNKIIQEYINVIYDKKSTLIAYGADHVRKQPLSREVLEEYPFLKDEYAFTVCRIEPENNIEMMIKAFCEMPDKNYVIVGNWDRSGYGKELMQKYAEYKNIYMLHAIYDQDKLDQIRSNCKIYVHGHTAGGTNPSLIEAMYLELPVFSFDIPYNIATTRHEAKYFKDSAALIFLFENMDKWNLDEISGNMKEIADNFYTWDKISKQYGDLF